MRSLQQRLGAGLVASLIAVFVLQWLAVSYTVRQLSEASMLRNMQHDIETLLAGLTIDATGRLRLDATRVEQVYHTPFSGSYYRIQSGASVQRSRSLWDQDLPGTSLAPGSAEQQRVPGPQAQLLLMLTRSYLLQGQPVSISVADDLTPLEQELARFRLRYALLTAALLAALLLLQAIVVHTGLAPLRRLRDDLKRLDHGDITALPENVPGELRPLVGELNRLLDTLRARLTRSRQALGNLAHALKTPLTILTDLAGQPRVRALPEVCEPLARQTQSLHTLIERELARARLAGAAPARHFDVARELPALVDTLKSIHHARPLAIETDAAPGLRLAADREDMLELLGNLLDNACKWGREAIRLGVATTDAAVLIEVEDDGPGCAPEEFDRLTQRGVRLDENAPGHGLGLTIVRDIVEGYGGRLEFARSTRLGGLCVRVHLPVTASPSS